MGPRIKRITPSGETPLNPEPPAAADATKYGHDTVDGLPPGAPRIFPDEPRDSYVKKQGAAAEPTAAPAQPPAKLTKLQAAMGKVSERITAIQAMGADIEELERTGGPQVVFEVATKAGKKQADDIRAKARKLRLDVQDMRKEATSLLNNLKNETWAVTDPTIAKLQAIEDNAKGQIEAEERKEADRKARHAQNIAAIVMTAHGCEVFSSGGCQAKLDSLAAIVIDDSYEEYEDEARRCFADARATLEIARDAALAREKAEDEAAERERQRAAIKLKIDNLKLIPDQVQGTDLENVRHVLASIRNNPPTAAEYGDQIELAELVHFKVVKELEREEEMLVIASTAPSDAEQDAAMANPAPRAEAPPEEPDPFTAPVTATVPARRPVPRPVVAQSPMSPQEAGALADRIERVLDAGLTDPHAGMDMTESDVPDLLAAAKRATAAFGALDQSVLSGECIAALGDLRAAIAFIDEFAD